MIKRLLFLFLIIVFNVSILHAQQPDSSSLQHTSASLLKRRVDFFQPSGLLEDILNKLSAEQDLRFSFSPDKIKHIRLKERKFSSVTLSLLVDALLENSGFEFLMVGRIIVITHTVKPAVPKAPASDTSRTGSISTAAASAVAYRNHIYSPEDKLEKLPLAERRKIRNLYKEEMKWSLRYWSIRGKPIGQKDSMVHERPVASPERNRTDPTFRLTRNPFFISAGLGLVSYVPRIGDNSSLSWREDLGYRYTVKNSISPSLLFGYIFPHLMVGAGVAYQHLTISGSGRQVIPKGKSGKADTIGVSFTDSYSIISIPVKVKLYKQRKKIFAAVGSGIEFDFFSPSEVQNNKFLAYYKKKNEDGVYSEDNNSFSVSTSIEIQGGVMLQEKIALAAELEYKYFFSPVSDNSLFSFYPNSLSFGISFFYFFHKQDLRRISGKRK